MVKLKNCHIGTKIGVVVDLDPVIMIVVTKKTKKAKRQKGKRQKDKKTKIQKGKKTKSQQQQKRQTDKKAKSQKDKKDKKYRGTCFLMESIRHDVRPNKMLVETI